MRSLLTAHAHTAAQRACSEGQVLICPPSTARRPQDKAVRDWLRIILVVCSNFNDFISVWSAGTVVLLFDCGALLFGQPVVVPL